MASPYFAALQSGGLVGDMSRRRGRMSMLAARRPTRPAGPAPIRAAVAPPAGGGGGGFMAPLASRLKSFGAPAPGPAPIGAMPGGVPLTGAPKANFEMAAQPMQANLLKAIGRGGEGGGPAAPGIFGKLGGSFSTGGFTGRGRGAMPELMAPAEGPAIQPMAQAAPVARALKSFGGGFGRMRGGEY